MKNARMNIEFSNEHCIFIFGKLLNSGEKILCTATVFRVNLLFNLIFALKTWHFKRLSLSNVGHFLEGYGPIYHLYLLPFKHGKPIHLGSESLQYVIVTFYQIDSYKYIKICQHAFCCWNFTYELWSHMCSKMCCM